MRVASQYRHPWRMANSEWRMSLPPRATRQSLFPIGPLCPPSRRRGERIVGPGMLRVAAAHLGAHRRVAAAPEAGQIARHLHRPVRRRQELDQQRDVAAGNRRVAVERRTTPGRGSIASARRPPRNRSEPASRSAPRNGSAPRRRGGVAADRAAARLECGVKFVGGKLGQRGLAVEERRKPVVVGGQRGIGQIRPLVAFGAAQETSTRSRHCRSALVHGSRSMPSRATPSARMRAAAAFAADRHRLLGQRERAEPAVAARAQARGRLIEGDLLARVDAFGEARLDLGERDRRGEQDAARGGAAGNLGHGEKWLARQRRRRDRRCAPRPLAKRNAPVPPPRFFAMRSG